MTSPRETRSREEKIQSQLIRLANAEQLLRSNFSTAGERVESAIQIIFYKGWVEMLEDRGAGEIVEEARDILKRIGPTREQALETLLGLREKNDLAFSIEGLAYIKEHWNDHVPQSS